jgi:hypothetical protein
MDKQLHSSDWIDQAKQRGYGGALEVLLIAVEPIAPIIAQGLWVAQPLAGLLGHSNALQQLAEALEEPDGVIKLRQRLSDDTQE